MKSVCLNYSAFRGGELHGRELCVWTRQRGYEYFPISYSLQDCFELICEGLDWEYERYQRTGNTRGIIHAMEQETEEDLSLIEVWNGMNFTSASSTDSNSTYYFEMGQ